MRLRGSFTLWFAAAALVPIALAALVTRELVSRSYLDDFADLQTKTEQAVKRSLHSIEDGVVQATEALANRQHDLIGGFLIELHKSDGTITHELRRGVRERSLPLMRGWGLDILHVLDPSDTVLAAPHYRPARGQDKQAFMRRIGTAAGQVFYTYEPIIEDNEVQTILVVESARIVRQGGYRVSVIGGRRIGRAFLEQIHQPGKVDVRIVNTSGDVVLGTERGWPPQGRFVPIRIPLAGVDGNPVAWVEARLSDRELQELLEQVTIGSVVLAGLALLLTLLLGVLVARRMTRNLDKLTLGARAAARGDLDHRIVVRGGDEIREVAKALNTMMDDLRISNDKLALAERVAAWQEIARRLAHEIKNPLTPIRMSVDTLRKTWERKHPSFAEIFDESTATILEETARLKRIVSEFSEFARLPKPQMNPCNINEIIVSALSLYKESVSIHQDLHTELPMIMGDRDQLTQVILNLLENARDAIVENNIPDTEHHIRVATQLVDDNVVRIVVSDTGTGVSAEAMEKLFTPYFTTKHAGSGTGLGLAIVHRIVSDHDGTITVRNRDPRGAEFTINIPGIFTL